MSLRYFLSKRERWYFTRHSQFFTVCDVSDSISLMSLAPRWQTNGRGTACICSSSAQYPASLHGSPRTEAVGTSGKAAVQQIPHEAVFSPWITPFFSVLQFFGELDQDARGLGHGAPPSSMYHTNIKKMSACRTVFTEQLLATGRRPQISKKARKSSHNWIGQNKKRERETNGSGWAEHCWGSCQIGN